MELLEHLIQEGGNWKEYIPALPTERVLGLDELCSLIDVGINGKMCDRVGIVRANYRRRKFRKFGDSPELRHLARDVIRWECRPYPTMQPPPLCYIVKPFAQTIAALPLFKYAYRHYLC